MNKPRRKSTIIVVSAIVLVAGLITGYYFLFMNPHRGTVESFATSKNLDAVLSRQQAEEDLQFLFDHLESRHPAWLDGSEDLVEAVTGQYRDEVSNLDDQTTVLELWQAAGRILSKLQDGHTRVGWRDPEPKLYINDFTQIQDFGHPLSINGVLVSEVLEQYLSIASYELTFYAEDVFYKRVIEDEAMLRWCGVDTTAGVDMTFQTDDGEQTFHYSFVPLDQVTGYDDSNQNEDWVYYDIDTEHDLGIFTLKSCNFNNEYRDVLSSFFGEVFSTQVNNIVVDLRGNGGGNSRVANEFLKYVDVNSYKTWDSAIRYGWYLHKNTNKMISNKMKPETFTGNIYVLTDTFTYSSAMDFAMLIGDNDLGYLVGSPSGNRPDSYGDTLSFQMPNSQLPMTVSFKRWYRVDKSKSGQPLMPDFVVSPSEALEKVYELIGE